MRPTLLKSFLVSLIFWFIATTLWWSFQQPSVNLAALAKLKALVPFLPFEVPETATILGSLNVQSLVLRYWLAPVFIAAALSGLLGFGVVWLWARGKRDERTARETGSGEYRGVTLTLGELPLPLSFPCDEVDLGAADPEILSRMTEGQKALLEEILGTISAHPDAYAGDGVPGSLLDHALMLASASLERSTNAGLLAAVATGFEMGKITAYQKADGAYVLKKGQDKEAAKILGTLNTWFTLPPMERGAVMLAVKYYTTPLEVPAPGNDVAMQQLARDLLGVLHQAPAIRPVVAPAPASAPQAQPSPQRSAQAPVPVAAPAPVAAPVARHVPAIPEAAPAPVPTVPAQPVYTQGPLPAPATPVSPQNLPELIFDAFMQALPTLSFQNRGLPKGVAAVAWKLGNRVYLLEIKLRETITARIPLELRGALTPNPKERSRLQPFTTELLKALDERGWLVKKINDTRLDAKEALWNVKAGKLEFKGVIIIDLPPEYLSQLPRDDSMYELVVTGTLFTNNSAPSMSKQDLIGSVLRPGPARPANPV